jgi:hypothetical protein
VLLAHGNGHRDHRDKGIKISLPPLLEKGKEMSGPPLLEKGKEMSGPPLL